MTFHDVAGETMEHYRDIPTGVQANGSLLLESVRQDDQGQYLCEASNGIGEGLSSVITLTVNGNRCNSYTMTTDIHLSAWPRVP